MENKYFVAYNDEIGVVWSLETGSIRVTDIEHAKALKEYLSKYINQELSVDEEKMLKTYFRDAFDKDEKLQILDSNTLLERKSISRLEIMVANDCNLDCKYCYACGGSYGLKSTRMSAKMAIEYLSALFDEQYDDVDEVMFFGGEPTLCPDTIEAVCRFFLEGVERKKIKKVPQYTMVSNATLINEKIARILCKYKIIVTVSVDGPKEINDKLRVDRNGKGTFERVKRGIEAIRNEGGEIRLIEATYTSEHQKKGYSRSDICEYLKTYFKVENIIVGDCEESTRDNTLLCANDEEWEYFYNQFDNGCKKERLLRAMKYRKITDITCESGYGSFSLMPSGEIYPCHFFVNHPEYQIAIYRNGVFDFSNYENVLEKLQISHKSKNKMCSNCWARVTCEMCPAQMLLYDIKGKKSYCHGERKNQEKMILKCAKELFEEKGTI